MIYLLYATEGDESHVFPSSLLIWSYMHLSSQAFRETKGRYELTYDAWFILASLLNIKEAALPNIISDMICMIKFRKYFP